MAEVDADVALRAADELRDLLRWAEVTAAVARVVAADDLERAERLAWRTLGVMLAADAPARVDALADVAAVLGRRHREAALAVVGDIEQSIAGITDPYLADRARASLARVTVPLDTGRAERNCRAISDGYRRSESLAEVALLIGEFDLDHARRLARSIQRPDYVAKALSALAKTRADAADAPYRPILLPSGCTTKPPRWRPRRFRAAAHGPTPYASPSRAVPAC